MFSLVSNHLSSRLFYGKRNTSNREYGFSLVEVLVVILIVSILMAIAIPIWVGQQKSQADDRTRIDASASANALKEVVIQYPTAPSLRYITHSNPRMATVWADLNGNGVVDDGEPSRKVQRHEDTRIAVVTVAPGKFEVYAWNPNGRYYVSNGEAVLWSSVTGGFEEGIHATSVSPS